MITQALLKLRIDYFFFSITVSRQLNAVPDRGVVHGISLAYYYNRASLAVHALINLRFHVCTSLAPRPMTMVFGLGMRLCVHMHTTLENGILRNGQQPGSAVNCFTNQDEFVAMKMLSGRRAPHCDKHQFRDK